MKLNQIAIFGCHTDESGRVSAIRRNGFYVRYRSAFPTVPGGHVHALKSRFFPFEKLVECVGFPPVGCVKIVEEQR
jgi:hypothetical protein